MYSRSVSSFCVELSSSRVGGCIVGPPPFFIVQTSPGVHNTVYQIL